VKTYDLSDDRQAAAYRVECAMQTVLFGQAYLSTDGTRVTVYDADEIIIRPRPDSDLHYPGILPVPDDITVYDWDDLP
jgi:hypothetical protein